MGKSEHPKHPSPGEGEDPDLLEELASAKREHARRIRERADELYQREVEEAAVLEARAARLRNQSPHDERGKP